MFQYIYDSYNDVINHKINDIIIDHIKYDDICDNTLINSKKYNTIYDIKKDIKYCISFTSRNKNKKIKLYLEDYLFNNHYKLIIFNGSLTNRIAKINSNLCYNYIYKNIFNYTYNDTIIKYKILSNLSTDIVKNMHLINSSLTGCFIDYLLRRIISELLNISFQDDRADYMTNNINIDISASYKICQNIQYNTNDIVKHIFITSLSHSLFFNEVPHQNIIDDLIFILDNENIKNNLIEPLIYLCKLLINDTKTIKLNSSFGVLKEPLNHIRIPADADLIIGDCLIDIKCTTNTSNSKCKELLQLLGYSAISYLQKDSIKINSIMILNILEGTIYKIDVSKIKEENYIKYIKLLYNE